MHYQWYPGHMSKAKRQMQEDLKLIDVIIELVDARIPYSSKNPDIDTLAKGKCRVILLNKADLADEAVTASFKRYYESKGFHVCTVNSKGGIGVKNVMNTVRTACKEKIEKDRARGIIGRPIRAMIVGIPNVGKSTFINSFAGKACTKTGNKPGVTKGKQWIRLSKDLELLDTPGILWPKFEDPEVGMMLAALLFMKRMSEETHVTGWKYTPDGEEDPDSIDLRQVPRHVRVYEMTGPLFFGAADKIMAVTLKEYTHVLILRMRGVPALDITAMNALDKLRRQCEKKGVQLILSHVNEQPLSVMKRSGFYDAVGAEFFCPHIDDALKKAEDL